MSLKSEGDIPMQKLKLSSPLVPAKKSPLFNIQTRKPKGLINLGNTCYLNAAIQCISQTSQIFELFLTDKYKKLINKTNKLGSGGKLATVFAKLFQSMWEDGTDPILNLFMCVLGTLNPEFGNGEQHDSQEFLVYLLDLLNEDFQSPIVMSIENIFGGNIKSCVQCLSCNHVSTKNEPFLSLSLSIPSIEFEMPYIFVRTGLTDGAGEYRTIQVSSNWSLSDFKIAIMADMKFIDLEKCNMDLLPEILELKIAVYGIYDSRISNILYDSQNITEILGMKIQVVLKSFESCTVFGNFVDSRIMKNPHFVSYVPVYFCSKLGFFGDPIYIAIPKYLEAMLRYPDSLFNENEEQIDNAIYYVELYHLGRILYTEILRVLCQISNYPLFSPKDLDVSDIPENLGDLSSDFSLNPVRNLFDLHLCKDKLNCADLSSKEEFYERNFFRQSIRLYPFGVYEYNSSSGEKKVIDGNYDGFPFREIKAVYSFNCDSVIILNFNDDVENFLFGPSNEYFYNRLTPENMCEIPDRPVADVSISLDTCIREFLKEEEMGPENLWNCPTCKDSVQIKKTLEISKLPEVLIFHLKRFSNSVTKIDTLVQCPVSSFDMGLYISSTSIEPSIKAPVRMESDSTLADSSLWYDLYAVINHYGTLSGGHYTATVKNFVNEKWYYMDDSKVRVVDESSIITSSVYILFYEKRNSEARQESYSTLIDFLNTNDCGSFKKLRTDYGFLPSGFNENGDLEGKSTPLDANPLTSEFAQSAQAEHIDSLSESRRSPGECL